VTFSETPLAGAYIVDVDVHRDARGYFARTFCAREFSAHGMDPAVVQASVSFNERAGIVRGLHYQRPPAAETKFVRCTRGAVLDVIVDLRPESPTFLRHVAVELSPANGRGVFIPRRFAHGYQVLEDATEVSYLMGEFYAPETAGGLLYSDPRLGIRWPLPVTDVSDRDRGWAPLSEAEAGLRISMSVGVGRA
jgi:dTDP-4-dehydrorhamnose 3,5-epimerase